MQKPDAQCQFCWNKLNTTEVTDEFRIIRLNDMYNELKNGTNIANRIKNNYFLQALFIYKT